MCPHRETMNLNFVKNFVGLHVYPTNGFTLSVNVKVNEGVLGDPPSTIKFGLPPPPHTHTHIHRHTHNTHKLACPPLFCSEKHFLQILCSFLCSF